MTRGEAAAAFTRALIKLEKEYLGRGPEDARTFFIEDMIVVRLRGILTPAEQELAKSESGREIVKESRRRLFDTVRVREQIATFVHEIIGCEVISLHTDISTHTGERVILLTVSENLDEGFAKQEAE
ncbi:MAG: DUF2294 domain-containing protein [Anaerolineae bacterium]